MPSLISALIRFLILDCNLVLLSGMCNVKTRMKYWKSRSAPSESNQSHFCCLFFCFIFGATQSWVAFILFLSHAHKQSEVSRAASKQAQQIPTKIIKGRKLVRQEAHPPCWRNKTNPGRMKGGTNLRGGFVSGRATIFLKGTKVIIHIVLF